MTDFELREQVRAKYAEAAAGGACGSDCGCGPGFYEGEQVGGILSLGCGNPLAVADLREGRPSSTSGRAGGWTSCCRRSASGLPASPGGST